MKIWLEERLKAILVELSKDCKISYALLFGSYSTGDYRPYSDIDIAVKFKGGWKEKNYTRKAGKLSLKLSKELER